MSSRSSWAPPPEEWAAIRARIEARCVEIGECMCYQSKQAVPVVNVGHGNRTMGLGRLYWLITGRALSADLRVTSDGGDPKCIAHLKERTHQRALRDAARRGAYSSLAKAAKAAKIATTYRRRSRFSEAAIQDVRLSPDNVAVVAARHGMSVSHAKAIRAGRSRRPLPGQNPWAAMYPVRRPAC